MKKVAIIGAGLLGGSVALSLRKLRPEVKVSLWARREAPLKLASELGIKDASSDLSVVLADADVVILSTPVGVMGELAQQIVDLRKGQKFILTDVGSVKRLTHELIEPIVSDSEIVYIGSHPMAGSETAGMEAARDNLLDSAACIITTERTDVEAELQQVEDMWTSLNTRVRRMTAEDHDYAVARISHFPHSLASIGAKVGLKYEDIGDLAGGGLRDTTRVAAGDPHLWTEILLENKDALQRSLHECVEELEQFQQILKENDEAAMLEYLTEAQRKRQLLK